MHMMFVDESGDPGYPPGKKWLGWGGSTHFVRVGVIIHGWKWKAWNDRLTSFKRNRGLTWDSEIRAGIVILDPTKETSDDNLRRFQSFLLTQSEHLDPLHIVEGAFFAKSHTCGCLGCPTMIDRVFRKVKQAIQENRERSGSAA